MLNFIKYLIFKTLSLNECEGLSLCSLQGRLSSLLFIVIDRPLIFIICWETFMKCWVRPTLDYWNLLYSFYITCEAPATYTHSFFLKITTNNY